LHTPAWQKPNSCLAFHLLPVQGDTDIYLMTNNAKKKQLFLLPVAAQGRRWHLSLNTANDAPDDIFTPGSEHLLTDQKKFQLQEQSTVVLIAK